MEELKTFSIVKALIREKGVRQCEIADVIGVSPVTFSNKISGKSQFTFEEIKTICEYLDVNPVIFFN